MPNLLYCAHCDGALIYRNVEGHDLYMCPLCSNIYEKTEDKFRYIGKLSGGIALKELLNNIDQHSVSQNT